MKFALYYTFIFVFLFNRTILSIHLKDGPEWTHPNNCDDKEKSDDNIIHPNDQSSIPTAKSNKWEKYGLGDSVYLFDYLDPVFQSTISKYFQRLYDEASKIKGEINDPYSLDNIQAHYGKKFTEIFPKIRKDEWDSWITYPQVDQLLNNWKYVTKYSLKTSFDNFDFNGDGRLDKREFILFSIIQNKDLDNTKHCENCYNEIFENLLDPMFSFLDCNKDGLVSSEDMWDGLKKLKRNTKSYSIYNCHMNLKHIEKYPRTISINDFILLNLDNNQEGKISKTQFRSGILLGYWQRQTEKNKIYYLINELNTLSKKESRWGNNGNKDIKCEELLSMFDA